MQTLTIFTPTYNRADLLVRGYEALKRQTVKDFIWIIIDDGSTDNTEQIVNQWIKEEKTFQIEYYYKQNGGLHTAYNYAIEKAKTELLVCIDSDDFMSERAVELIVDFWKKNGSDEYAGIVGLDYTLDNRVIGDPLPSQKSVNLIDLLVGKYNIYNGDRTNVVRTELYKRFAPMEVFQGEKNFNPHYMHLQISQEYDFLVLNENLRYVEYQENGMTNNIYKQYYNSPKSFLKTRELYLSFKNTSVKFKFRNSIHYVSSCLFCKKRDKILKNPSGIIYSILAFIPGIMLYEVIKMKNK